MSYKIKITEEIGKSAVLGGAFLGGGGGGSYLEGFETVESALKFGDLTLLSSDYLNDEDTVITASAVGSPASKEACVLPEYHKRLFDMYNNFADEKIEAIITNENGGMSTTNGWILSAITGLPIIDAPCNGRAHPTAPMGSMGLSELDDYETIQVCVGGNKDRKAYVETVAKGTLTATSNLVRQSAVESEGLVTVLRNPVKGKYVKENAAMGAIKQAIEVGEIFMKNKDNAKGVVEGLKGIFKNIEVLASGTVSKCDLVIQGGFDVGEVVVDDVELTFWNEYMTAEKDGKRISTFPNLIATINGDTGAVCTTAQIEKGMNIIVVSIPKEELKLGSGMFDKNLFTKAEEVLNKELIKYIF